MSGKWVLISGKGRRTVVAVLLSILVPVSWLVVNQLEFCPHLPTADNFPSADNHLSQF